MTGRHQRWRRRLACFWVCLAAGAGAACGNDKPTSSGDGGAREEQPADDDGAAPDQSGLADTGPLSCPVPDGGISGAATCNDLIAAGPCVGQIQVDDNAPAPRGGGLVAGTFELTERILYTNPGGATGPTGEPMVETLALRGAGTSWTLERAGFAPTTATRTSASASVSGLTIRLLPTCPGGDGGLPTDADSDGGPAADAGGGSDDAGDAGPPAASGELVYYTSFDSGASLVLYRLGSAGPVRADTYVRR